MIDLGAVAADDLHGIRNGCSAGQEVRRMRGRSVGGWAPTPCHGSRGITYIWTLIVVALIGAGLAMIGQTWHAMAQREKERDLLFAGQQIQRAIEQYYENSPVAAQRFPRKLEDLLRDERYPTLHRYLRKIYVEPMTGTTRWGLVEYPGIGITGVYSLSERPPMKKANFPPQFTQFSAAAKYSDWKFVYVPTQPPPSGPEAPGIPATAPGALGAPALGEPIPTLKP
jgi:type II secretory pathway pseudopilin PulG